MKLEETTLSVRTVNSLRRAGVETTDDLEHLSRRDLVRIRGIGAICIREIEEYLGKELE